MTGLTSYRLGVVEYADGLELQKQFSASRRAQLCGDTLLLVQHPAVLTLGRGGKPANVLATPAYLESLGVAVHHTDRGGDVTYHGPGQIVGYPLLFLPPGQQDVRKYVRRIEELAYQRIFAAHLGGIRADQVLGRFATA